MPSHHRGPDHERLALDAYLKLSRAVSAVDAPLQRGLAAAGLTVSQFGVLEALHHLGPLNQRELGRKILKSGGNVTVVVDNLERNGLVTRRRGGNDRRHVQVSLTETGRLCIESVFPDHVRRVVQAFAVLSADETRQLAELCKRLGLGQAALGQTALTQADSAPSQPSPARTEHRP